MLYRIFPFLSWFREYTFAHFRADFIAGLTVALVLIPQSMAYAQLANLPAYYGLYAAFLPPMIASFFGSSRQLATGPVAMVSLMTAAALEPIATAGTEAFVAYAILLCLLVGIFQFLLGAFRLGLIINFISHPVVNGFTNAGALIIATSQLSNLLGVNIEKAEHHYETVYRAIESALNYTHLPTLGFAVLAFIIMIGLKRLNPRIPAVLAAVIVTTIVSLATGFERKEHTTLGMIRSPNAADAITELNRTLDDIDARYGERIEINRLLRDAQQRHARNAEIVQLEHRIVLVNLDIDELKERISQCRAHIKGFLFRAVTDSGGALSFYLAGDVAAGQETEGGIWRLNVGSLKIDEANLTMTSGGKVVGTIPRGLPSFGLPDVDAGILLRLFPMVVIISLIGFMEAIAIAKAMAAKTGQRLDPDQELIGQGLANIVGSFGRSYPVSGSFSRSAVNIQSGAVSGMSGFFTSTMVLVALIFLTPLMYYLPQSVLAAIIMVAVLGLVNVSGFIHAWQAKKFDGLVTLVTFIGTLAFAPHLEWGILIGVALSLVESLYRHMRPDIAILSKHPDGSFRNARRWNLKECRYISVIRFNGSLFFASANYLEDQILEAIAKMPDLKHILIVGNGINELDATGVEAVLTLIKRLREAGYEVSFSGLNDHIADIFKRTHLFDVLGENHVFRSVQRAIKSIHSRAHAGSQEEQCPLIKPIEKEPEEDLPGAFNVR